MTAMDTALDERKLQELEEKFDPEMRFRPTVAPATFIVVALLITLSLFHYYTAGFGLLRETTHRGVHLAFVLGLIFLVFGASKKAYESPARRRRPCASPAPTSPSTPSPPTPPRTCPPCRPWPWARSW